jgi:hypothetical protein
MRWRPSMSKRLRVPSAVMGGQVVALRLIATADELGPVVLLVDEFEEWIREPSSPTMESTSSSSRASTISSSTSTACGSRAPGSISLKLMVSRSERRFETTRRRRSRDQTDVCAAFSSRARSGTGDSSAVDRRRARSDTERSVSIVLASSTKRIACTEASGSCPAGRTTGSSRACPRCKRPRSSCASISERTSQ